MIFLFKCEKSKLVRSVVYKDFKIIYLNYLDFRPIILTLILCTNLNPLSFIFDYGILNIKILNDPKNKLKLTISGQY